MVKISPNICYCPRISSKDLNFVRAVQILRNSAGKVLQATKFYRNSCYYDIAKLSECTEP